jgi:hypothetical protein
MTHSRLIEQNFGFPEENRIQAKARFLKVGRRIVCRQVNTAPNQGPAGKTLAELERSLKPEVVAGNPDRPVRKTRNEPERSLTPGVAVRNPDHPVRRTPNEPERLLKPEVVARNPDHPVVRKQSRHHATPCAGSKITNTAL